MYRQCEKIPINNLDNNTIYLYFISSCLIDTFIHF